MNVIFLQTNTNEYGFSIFVKFIQLFSVIFFMDDFSVYLLILRCLRCRFFPHWFLRSKVPLSKCSVSGSRIVASQVFYPCTS